MAKNSVTYFMDGPKVVMFDIKYSSIADCKFCLSLVKVKSGNVYNLLIYYAIGVILLKNLNSSNTKWKLAIEVTAI